MLVVSATKEAVVAGQGRAGKRESVAVVVGFRFSAMEVVMGGERSIGSSDHSSQSQRSEK